MTHEERATLIVADWATRFDATAAGGNGAFNLLIDKISRGMAEASNDELERRRTVEAERDNLQAIIADWKRFCDTTWLRAFFADKAHWSLATFGTGRRTKGITEHIRRELNEIERDSADLYEWVDVVLLAMDGFMRTRIGNLIEHRFPDSEWSDRWGATPPEHFEYAADAFIKMLIAKDQTNRRRNWPPPGPDDQPTEHVRE